MIINSDKINDPNLSEEEDRLIFRAFLRRYEKERNTKRWESLLEKDYDFPRPAAAPSRSAKIRKLIIPLISVAAALLLFVLLVPGMFSTQGEDLLAEFVTETNMISYRSAGDSEADVLRLAFEDAFTEKRYAAAQELGRKLTELSAAVPRDRFNLGLSYMLGEDLPQAAVEFRNLIGSGGELLTEARYYLGLTLLLQGDTEAGFAELSMIKATDGTAIYNKAKALLEAKW